MEPIYIKETSKITSLPLFLTFQNYQKSEKSIFPGLTVYAVIGLCVLYMQY